MVVMLLYHHGFNEKVCCLFGWFFLTGQSIFNFDIKDELEQWIIIYRYNNYSMTIIILFSIQKMIREYRILYCNSLHIYG